jgi:hypothetical protein
MHKVISLPKNDTEFMHPIKTWEDLINIAKKKMIRKFILLLIKIIKHNSL